MSDLHTNPFASAQAWDVNTEAILPAGDHVVTVREIDGSTTSSGGYPQLEITVGNADGQIRDWLVVIPATIGKVVQLFDAAGLERPSDTQVDSEGEGFRFDPRYLQQLVGKDIGVIVRSEPDRKDPTRTRDRVKGYVEAMKVAKSDLPSLPSAEQIAAARRAAAVDADQDRIPF